MATGSGALPGISWMLSGAEAPNTFRNSPSFTIAEAGAAEFRVQESESESGSAADGFERFAANRIIDLRRVLFQGGDASALNPKF